MYLKRLSQRKSPLPAARWPESRLSLGLTEQSKKQPASGGGLIEPHGLDMIWKQVLRGEVFNEDVLRLAFRLKVHGYGTIWERGV